MRITVRPRQPQQGHPPDDDRPDGPEAPQVGFTSRRARVREALRCPYCRDLVERRDALTCARSACGAVYHRECWRELGAGYGGCAIYGCGSTEARELSGWRWWVRLLRLVLATLLFPPRIVRLVRQADTEGLGSIYRRALNRARRIHGWANANGDRQTLLVLIIGIPLSYAIVLPRLYWGPGVSDRDLGWVLGLLFAVPFLMLILPALLAFLATVGVALARGLAHAFTSELAALARAERPEGTFLDRLRAGAGSKAK